MPGRGKLKKPFMEPWRKKGEVPSFIACLESKDPARIKKRKKNPPDPPTLSQPIGLIVLKRIMVKKELSGVRCVAVRKYTGTELTLKKIRITDAEKKLFSAIFVYGVKTPSLI